MDAQYHIKETLSDIIQEFCDDEIKITASPPLDYHNWPSHLGKKSEHTESYYLRDSTLSLNILSFHFFWREGDFCILFVGYFNRYLHSLKDAVYFCELTSFSLEDMKWSIRKVIEDRMTNTREVYKTEVTWAEHYLPVFSQKEG
jgi:hypothetical protein